MRARGFILACALAIAAGATFGLREAGDDPARVAEAGLAFDAAELPVFRGGIRPALDVKATTIRAYMARSSEFAARARPAFVAGTRLAAASEALRGDCIHWQTSARVDGSTFARAAFSGWCR